MMSAVRYQWTRRAGLVVVDCDGRDIATLDKSMWGERAGVAIEGRSWEFGKDGSARTAVPLGGGTPMVARRASIWSSQWQVGTDGAAYTIARAGLFTSRLEVCRDGAVLGTVASSSLWSNRPFLEIDSSVPQTHAVFLLWIAFLVRARASASASSTTS